MSSGKLDRSLDEILAQSNKNPRHRSNRPRAQGKSAGIKKNTTSKATSSRQQPSSRVQNQPSAFNDLSAVGRKCQVNGLPLDVTKANIQEYFSKTAGPVQKVIIPPQNRSTSGKQTAIVIFRQPESAMKAVKEVDGVEIDHQPLHVGILFESREVDLLNNLRNSTATKPPKSLAARAEPLRKKGKQPARRDSSRRNQVRKSRQEPKKTRSAKKTAEELDAEMADYWTEAGGNNAPASTIQPSATQTAPAAPDTDVGMNEL